jgi:hypothetical protein
MAKAGTAGLGERQMKKGSRFWLFFTLMFVLLAAACGAQDGATPTSFAVTLPPADGDLTGTPVEGTQAAGTAGTAITDPAGTAQTPTGGLEAATAASDDTDTQPSGTQVIGSLSTATQDLDTETTRTPVIPVTGPELLLVECQFCVDTRAHALLVLPDTATFQITSPAPSTTASDTEPQCSTVEVNNGRQVVLCSGPEMTPLVVNICTDANTCTDFPIDLLACPLAPGGAISPNQTLPAPGAGDTQAAPTTSGGVVISTATPLGTATSTATTTP